MKRLPIVAMACTMLAAPTVLADSTIHASLSGYDEVPAVSSKATGSFTGKITKDNAIEYELTYSDLESDATQSHIHFGKPGTNGGVAVWFCVGTGPGAPTTGVPAGTPACPVRGGTLTGVITAANVVGPAGQGIAATEFEEFVDAIKEGATYVNVHSQARPGGEIRGLVK